MKTIYLLLFVSLNALANITVKENPSVANSMEKTNDTTITNVVPNPKNNSIAGLKIVTCESQKYGKHIYVTSDLYVKKKISIYNTVGKKVYSISTVGAPIYLSKIENGLYKVKITEGKKTEIKDLVVN
ncbi:hypothetical protein [Flavobacterium sp.]|uniref:hypothetical protein n=1 Tax=Flavobacterium sp. TaxID=239 RepID=UPI00260DCDCD|nr:hypothetical protein [Flavobacterium sp.]